MRRPTEPGVVDTGTASDAGQAGAAGGGGNMGGGGMPAAENPEDWMHAGSGCGDFTNGQVYVRARVGGDPFIRPTDSVENLFLENIIDTGNPTDGCGSIPGSATNLRIRPSDGRLLYIYQGAVREFTPDVLDAAGVPSSEVDPRANDSDVPTPGCDLVVSFAIHPFTSALYYSCLLDPEVESGFTHTLRDGMEVSVYPVQAATGETRLLLPGEYVSAAGGHPDGSAIYVTKSDAPADGNGERFWATDICDEGADFSYYSSLGMGDSFYFIWNTDCREDPEVFRWTKQANVEKLRSLSFQFTVDRGARTQSGIVGPDGSVYLEMNGEVDGSENTGVLRYRPDGQRLWHYQASDSAGLYFSGLTGLFL